MTQLYTLPVAWASRQSSLLASVLHTPIAVIAVAVDLIADHYPQQYRSPQPLRFC